MIKTKKYSYLDSIRGYAVLMVLVTHVFAFGGGNANPDIMLAKLWVQCRMGVMLFYMISALTLFLSYEQKIKIERFPIKAFFIRRIFRIVPLFYLVCVYMICFNKYSLINIISTMTFTNGFIPKYIHGIVVGGWSIAVESVFYLMVPILFKYITTINRSVIFFFLTTALAIILHYIAFKYGGKYFSNDVLLSWTLVWLPLQLPIFAIGIFLYFLFFRSGFITDNHLIFNKYVSYFLIFCSIYFFLICSYSSRLFIFENIALSFPLMLFVIGMAIYQDTFLNNNIMQFFGKISYSFYLFHPIVISLVGLTFLNKISTYTSPTIGFASCYFILLLLTSIVSYFSYKFIEQPFQKIGIRLIERCEAQPAP